ncbi:hypothetical protein RHDC3_02246 [Rhodocyclaceae bacterium]|nr:hypothetical protein RHDC3_02246 [Rhodocyclaceae bacterium]
MEQGQLNWTANFIGVSADEYRTRPIAAVKTRV